MPWPHPTALPPESLGGLGLGYEDLVKFCSDGNVPPARASPRGGRAALGRNRPGRLCPWFSSVGSCLSGPPRRPWKPLFLGV